MSTLFVKVKKIFRQIIQSFVLIITNIPRYVQWTISSLLDQTRRKNLLILKGLTITKEKTIFCNNRNSYTVSLTYKVFKECVLKKLILFKPM